MHHPSVQRVTAIVLGMLLALGPGAARPQIRAETREQNTYQALDVFQAPYLVRDIYAGAEGADPKQLTAVNGTLFFAADDGQHGTELWKSNGTVLGTLLVRDIDPGPSDSEVGGLVDLEGTLFFGAESPGSAVSQVWKSDGTAAGTVLVKDITPGPDSSFESGVEYNKLANVNGVLYFRVRQSLWKSDGTPEGTTEVKNIGGYDLTVVGDTLFFVASDDVSGWELWKSDGTAEGTVLVKDIHPTTSAYPGGLTAVNSTLYFTADDGSHGYELWKSDGMSEGTVMVKDINPATTCTRDGTIPGMGSFPCSSYAGVMTVYGDVMVMSADDGIHGRELWISDFTGAGTVLLQDIHPLTTCGYRGEDPGSGSNPCDSDPDSMTDANGTLYFTADDGTHGRELWALKPTSPACTEINGVTLEQVTPDPIYLGSEIELSATLAPLTATAPYSYSIDGGETMTTTETMITFTRPTLAIDGGTTKATDAPAQRPHAVYLYTFDISAWNCAMTTPVTDTILVDVVTPPAVEHVIWLPFALNQDRRSQAK